MDGNSAKDVPILDRLVDIPSAKPQTAPATSPQSPTTLTKPALASTQGAVHSPVNSVTPQEVGAPYNRRIDKSKFEIELTAIVSQIMREHINNASEQIVQEVLREVRARLPGQRKN